jgi:adhesin transport system outer membrane protein
LLRVRAEVSELQAQLDSGKSALFPELSARLVQQHGDVSGQSTQVYVGFESKWGGGLSNFSAIQAAAQRLQAKNEEMEHRSRKLIEQIRADQNQLVSTRSRVKAFGEVSSATQSVAQSWSRQFAAGKKSWQDVLNAVREATQAQIQLADAIGLAAVIEWRLVVLTRGVDAVLQAEMNKP